MSLAIWVGNHRYEIGSPSFLKALFSTIYVRLEAGEWGGKFPVFMNEFYSGTLTASDASFALEELDAIALELGELKASRVVWDFEAPQELPPWSTDEDYDPHASAREYFLTSEGRDVFDVLRAAFREASTQKADVKIS